MDDLAYINQRAWDRNRFSSRYYPDRMGLTSPNSRSGNIVTKIIPKKVKKPYTKGKKLANRIVNGNLGFIEHPSDQAAYNKYVDSRYKRKNIIMPWAKWSKSGYVTQWPMKYYEMGHPDVKESNRILKHTMAANRRAAVNRRTKLQTERNKARRLALPISTQNRNMIRRKDWSKVPAKWVWNKDHNVISKKKYGR